MLSDDSSSESETGRFKSSSKSERSNNNQHSSRPPRGSELLPDLARSRNNDRSYGRDYDKRNEERGKFERRRSRDRYEFSRGHSPSRRRYSIDRSREKLASSRDNDLYNRSREKDRDIRRPEKSDRFNRKRSKSPGSSVAGDKKTHREETKKTSLYVRNSSSNDNELKNKTVLTKTSQERDKTSRSKHRESSTTVVKVCDPKQYENIPKKTILPRLSESVPLKEKSACSEKEVTRSKSRRYSTVEEISDIEEPASYYNMVPAKTENFQEDVVHSVTDSSEDEEKLRAKLLNLEKELDKSKKKKSKKSKKKSKQKDRDDHVEVSSTTDIQEKESEEKKCVDLQMEIPEVSSTQIRIQKDSSEEGEICSDDESTNIVIEPSDLRHKLKRSVASTTGSPDLPDKNRPRAEVVGPALPQYMQRKKEHSITPEVEGPKLPPHLKRKPEVGPSIPTELRKKLAEAPQEFRLSSSEDEGIGPLPHDGERKLTDAHKKLEERALRMKISELEGGSSKSDAKVREEWMLELPEAKAKHIGLGPRQFRAKEGPDMSDRSSWTDTPQQKALKAAGVLPPEEASTTALQQEASRRYVEERDRDQEKAIKKHKKKHKREESLLDIHQKKLKKKKKKEEKEEGCQVRRPFDRNVDLQANRFDDAQKRSIIKKAQHLDTRFSAGQAKFL